MIGVIGAAIPWARTKRWLPLVMSFLVAGCATLPAVDEDIAKASYGADQQGVIRLMGRQDERIAKVPFTAGNSVQLLRNGEATFQAMASAIEAARQRIDVESYIFDDAEGSKIAALLLAKSAQGVTTNLIYDAIGSYDTPTALFDRLRQGGVHVLEYHPLSDPLDINRRDHRKLLIVDAEVAIVGGVNISEVYKNRRTSAIRTDDPEKMPWRDTDVLIRGPSVAQFERSFMKTWIWNKGAPIPPPPATPAARPGDALVLDIDGDPNDNRPLIYRALMVSIALARKSIHLTTGFFVPTPDLTHALERASRRGVDVEIVVPAHSDSGLAIEAGRGSYSDLLEAGVRIYERRGVVLHAKTAVIDGALSIVGSSNLDWRSVIYNTEDDAVIIDPSFAQQMEALFQFDIAHSRQIDPKRWGDRPFYERFLEWRARLIEFLL